MTELLKEVCELFNQELRLHRLKKKQLWQICTKLQGVSLTTKKHMMATTIYQELFKQMYRIYQEWLSVDGDSQKTELKQKLIQNFEKLVSDIVGLKNVDTVCSKVCALFLQKIESQSKPEIEEIVMEKQDADSEIKNVWDQQENTWKQCVCPQPPSSLKCEKNTIKCYKCQKPFHPECFWGPMSTQLPECSFCFLIHCHPHKLVRQIIFAGYLPFTKRQNIINLNIKPDKKQKNVSLEARCVKLNPKSMFEISWPDSGAIYSNKVKITDFKPLSIHSSLKKRTDDSIRIPTCKNGKYSIMIENKPCSQKVYKINKRSSHLVMIVLVTHLSSQEIETNLASNTLSTYQSKAILQDYLNHDGDLLSIQKLTISLTCQYFKTRMIIPVRSMACNTHFQPFDLHSMIISGVNASSPSRTWKCPICDKRAYHILVDEYIKQIMDNNPDAAQITFNRRGELEISEKYIPQHVQDFDRSKEMKVEKPQNKKDNAEFFIDLSNNYYLSGEQRNQKSQSYENQYSSEKIVNKKLLKRSKDKKMRQKQNDGAKSALSEASQAQQYIIDLIQISDQEQQEDQQQEQQEEHQQQEQDFSSTIKNKQIRQLHQDNNEQIQDEEQAPDSNEVQKCSYKLSISKNRSDQEQPYVYSILSKDYDISIKSDSEEDPINNEDNQRRTPIYENPGSEPTKKPNFEKLSDKNMAKNSEEQDSEMWEIQRKLQQANYLINKDYGEHEKVTQIEEKAFNYLFNRMAKSFEDF